MKGHAEGHARRRRIVFVLLAIAAVSAAAFGLLAAEIAARGGRVALDARVDAFVVAHRPFVVLRAMRVLTWLGSTTVVVPVVAVTGLISGVRRRDWRSFVILAIALAGTIALYLAFKPAFGRLRPLQLELRPLPADGTAFPSGHAAASVAAWPLVVMALSGGWRKPMRVAAAVVGVLIVVLVGVSRLYVRAHWLTDVLGGWTLAGAWTCLVLAVAVASTAPRPEAGRIVERAGSSGG